MNPLFTDDCLNLEAVSLFTMSDGCPDPDVMEFARRSPMIGSARRDHQPPGGGDVYYQRCGGGRRVIRKPFGAD